MILVRQTLLIDVTKRPGGSTLKCKTWCTNAYIYKYYQINIYQIYNYIVLFCKRIFPAFAECKSGLQNLGHLFLKV